MDSFITWVGGKKLLRKEIVKRFPEKIDRYVEVFGGAAWVLFYKEKYAKEEVYNDINGELVNLFRCVKYHYKELEKELQFMLDAREIFDYCKQNRNNPKLTNVQRATMFYYLIKTSFGAKLETYSTSFNRPQLVLKDIEKIAKRLSKVIIENRDFCDILARYDKAGTLFYCDPPYYNTEKMYQGINDTIFNEKQHIQLNDILKNIKGKFVLSYNDTDFVRNLYYDYNIQKVQRYSNLSFREGKKGVYKELIITNF